jgi:glycosyltransferase involved in cell wall biosynthesis
VIVNANGARAGGGLRQLEPLVRELALARPSWDIVVVGYPPRPERSLPFPVSVTIRGRRTVKGLGRLTERVQSEYLSIRRLMHGAQSVLLSPLNYAVFGIRPQVLFSRNAKLFDDIILKDHERLDRTRLTIQSRLARMSLLAASHVVVPTRAMAQYVGAYLSDERYSVLPHAIDVQAAVAASHREITPIAKEWANSRRHKLLYVGSTAPQKNIRLLARTVYELQSRSNVRCALGVTFGQDARSGEVAAFRQDVERLSLNQSVYYLGSVALQDIFPLYRATDVVLVPSVIESFGLPLLEAMAIGVPIVASRIPAFEEIGQDFVWYHEPRDPVDAARKVEQAIGSSGLPHAGLRAHLSGFMWSSYSSQLALILERAASQSVGC